MQNAKSAKKHKTQKQACIKIKYTSLLRSTYIYLYINNIHTVTNKIVNHKKFIAI